MAIPKRGAPDAERLTPERIRWAVLPLLPEHVRERRGRRGRARVVAADRRVPNRQRTPEKIRAQLEIATARVHPAERREHPRLRGRLGVKQLSFGDTPPEQVRRRQRVLAALGGIARLEQADEE